MIGRQFAGDRGQWQGVVWHRGVPGNKVRRGSNQGAMAAAAATGQGLVAVNGRGNSLGGR
jgi:hypothetical protein